jgi:hypothetical protein
MSIKIYLLFLFSALLLTMCGTFSEIELANPIEGLSCTGSIERGMQCYYTCPEGRVGPINFEGDPSLSASKGDLDRRFCESAPQSNSTASPATASPSPTNSPTVVASATVLVPVTSQDPLLLETISMCDLGGKLINFRIVESAPELTGKTLEVQIASQESICYINPTNPGLLTCSIPNDISFPAHIVVSLDGAVVNDFVYSGMGCSILTTPTPAKKIRSYP